MKIKVIKLSLFLGVLTYILISCNPGKKYEKEEQQQIQEYLGTLGDTAYVIKPSGLIVIPLVEGDGAMPQLNDTVGIRYKGFMLDGRVFASNASEDQPLFCIAGTGDLMDGYYSLIEGLSEGVLYIKLGGKARLLTPSSLAYGSTGDGSGYIGGYTPLLWEIEMVDLRPAGKK
jgi:FKBP-type peptidyl-prolyl cis-trans isomerase FkpA